MKKDTFIEMKYRQRLKERGLTFMPGGKEKLGTL